MGISWKTDERLLGIGRFDHQPAGALVVMVTGVVFAVNGRITLGEVYGIYFL